MALQENLLTSTRKSSQSGATAILVVPLTPAQRKKAAAAEAARAITSVLRRHTGYDRPTNGVAADDVCRAVRAAYLAGVLAEKKRSLPLVRELREVIDWTRVEKAPLRELELASIQRVLDAHADAMPPAKVQVPIFPVSTKPKIRP